MSFKTSMPDSKLRFNPQTMQYEAVTKKNSRLRNIVYVLLSGIAFGLLFIIIGMSFIKSSDLRKKEHDLEVYKETYSELEQQYQQNVEMLRKLEMQDRRLFREIFETDPPDTTLLSNELLLNNNSLNGSEDVNNAFTVVKTVYSKLENLAWKEEVRLGFARYFIHRNQRYISSLPIRMPLREESYTLVSGFGKRIHPIFKTPRQHNGIDFASRAGTEVLAAGDGLVQVAPKTLAGYGNVVYIRHRDGLYSLYAQLLEAKVQPGDQVKAGQVIGFVGSTGISIGPHLHYEIWKDGIPVDPIQYILTVEPRKYMLMMRIAAQYNQCLS